MNFWLPRVTSFLACDRKLMNSSYFRTHLYLISVRWEGELEGLRMIYIIVDRPLLILNRSIVRSDTYINISSFLMKTWRESWWWVNIVEIHVWHANQAKSRDTYSSKASMLTHRINKVFYLIFFIATVRCGFITTILSNVQKLIFIAYRDCTNFIDLGEI